MDNTIKDTASTNSEQIGQVIDQVTSGALAKRKKFERTWYDNTFFDDGQHFRYVSKKTGQIIDTVNRNTTSAERAIPRASRQIRGIANLLKAAEPYPVVYPERLTRDDFATEEEYMEEMKQAQQIAKRKGNWLTTEWTDNQDMFIKITEMLLLSAKHGISYLKIWGDPRTQSMHTAVRDAFDLILYGDRKEMKELPFVTEAARRAITSIQSDPLFEGVDTSKLSPDNKYASSEIKDAYMQARFGSYKEGEQEPTILHKESFIKEIISRKNLPLILKIAKDNAGQGKSLGDTIMRHVHSAGGITLIDEYVDLDEYPYVDYRYEPGTLYQTALIERFIPQNKSVDIIMTRLERWINAMVVGIWATRKGENLQISNFPGGQKVEYEQTPPTQIPVGNAGNTPFNVISLLDKYIEEQGASTSALNQLPTGVKSGVAIESVKATEYANLKIANDMLKMTIKNVSLRMFECGDKYIIDPQTVDNYTNGEPDFFRVIGQTGMDAYNKVNKQLPPNVVPISKDDKVRIEIETGMGLTMQGKRETMQQVITFMIQLVELKVMPVEALRLVVKKFLDTFGFGSTQEFMEAMENGQLEGQMTEDNVDQVKIGIAEVMKDLGLAGPEQEEKLVNSTKVGVLEALKESGILDNLTQPQEKPAQPNKVSINYKDLPVDGKVQAASMAGIQITPQTAHMQDIVNKPKPMNRSIGTATA